ncbi:hypothetical protein CTAYLR_002708 [Chrysophaeum taylorii]|uniref:Uncharacterized protein n=1 Tax=Chrysophaeum taylorii TaxID=2483200 RepID=A0AAD7XN73_9STRA|nr:hypothetical protein CTAYLR_002708 [Chrysophaeum taylorii]
MDYDALRQRDTADKGYNLPKQRGLATTFVFEDLLSYSYDLGEAGEGDAATEAGGFGKSFTLTDVNFGGLEGDSSVSNSGRGDGYFVDGTLFRGNQFDGHLGLSVSAAGDINGDGGDDVVVGAPGTTRRKGLVRLGPSRAVLRHARRQERARVYGKGFHITGENEGDYFGSSPGAFDFDDDAIDDILVGADGYNDGEGAAALIYGR